MATPNLFNSFVNFFETPQTIVFIHRWFAFVVFIAITIFYFTARKQDNSIENKNGLNWLLGIVIFQIVLGILTVLLHVQIAIALAHQAGALALFALMIYFMHRFRALDAQQVNRD
jgi:heme a synthase